MAKGDLIRAIMKMKHSPAGKKYLKSKKKKKDEGKESVYFKGIKRQTIESRLKEAGIDPQRFKKKK